MVPLQTLTQPTDHLPFTTGGLPKGKRTMKRKRAPNFEEEEDEYLAMCLVKLARGTSEILEPPASLVYKYLRQQNKILKTITTTTTTVDFIKKDQEKTSVDVKKTTTVDVIKKDEEKKSVDVKKVEEPKVYICNVCGKSFPCPQALGGHTSCHRSKSPDEGKRNVKSDGKIHECEICHKTFSSGQALGGHKRKHYDGVILAVGVSGKKRSSDYGSGETVKTTSNESVSPSEKQSSDDETVKTPSDESVSAENRSSDRSAEAVRSPSPSPSPSNEGVVSAAGPVIRDFDLNDTWTGDLYCDETA